MAVGEEEVLVERLRAAVRGGEAASGVRLLRDGHHVFTMRLGHEEVVAKLYPSQARAEPEREWQALCSFQSLRLSPRPLSFHPADDLPAVLMECVPGTPVDALALSDTQLAAIGAAHVALRQMQHRSPWRHATNHPAVVLRRACDNCEHFDPAELKERSESVEVAWSLARRWLATGDAQAVGRPPRQVLCRGDTNLVNYLFAGDRLWLVDFEDSGLNDPAFELADMAEHLNARPVAEAMWERMADALRLRPADRLRCRHGRRLAAIFWLTILVGREIRGRTRGRETPEDQAQHMLSLFEGA
jgi:aminoglycoside phosphotransferase (APT) family kinase protein